VSIRIVILKSPVKDVSESRFRIFAFTHSSLVTCNTLFFELIVRSFIPCPLNHHRAFHLIELIHNLCSWTLTQIPIEDQDF
jgi:hypothetical protein